MYPFLYCFFLRVFFIYSLVNVVFLYVFNKYIEREREKKRLIAAIKITGYWDDDMGITCQ